MSDSYVKGKYCLVTGCTSGIGMAATKLLAEQKPAGIYLAVRSQSKGEALKKELAELGVMSEILLGDVSTTAGCLAVAKAMKGTGKPLDVLMSNAGIWNASREAAVKPQMSKDGFEAHFATNYMSMVLLLTELKPLIDKSKTRVVVTGSFTSFTIAKGIVDFDNLQGEKKTTASMPNDVLYAQSKLLQYMWARKFATTVSSGASIVVFDPGACVTNVEIYDFVKKNMACLFPVMKKMMGMREPVGGAQVGMWAMDSPEAGPSINGMAVDWGTYGAPKKVDPVTLSSGIFPTYKKSAPSLVDEAQVEKLWALTEELRIKTTKSPA